MLDSDCIQSSPDFGADGLAALSRPHNVVRTDGVYRNSVADGVVEVRRFDDATLFDEYRAVGKLTLKQHDAAEKLYSLWVDAGLAPGGCGGYGAIRGRSLSDDGPTAHDTYRAAMRLLTHAEAWAVSDVLWGSALPLMRMGALQGGLDTLAKEWGL